MSNANQQPEPPDFLGFVEQVSVPFATGAEPMGNRMARFQRAFFEAIAPALRAVCLSQPVDHRKFWVERTKGASKDTDATLCILYLLAFAQSYVRIRVGAYKQDQADEVRQIARQVLQLDHPLNRALNGLLTVQADSIIRKRDGSLCEILTSDNRGTHGGRPNMVLLNEATHVSDEDFAATMLDDADKVPTCVTLVCTNAGYHDTWQWRWRELATTSPRWQAFIFDGQAPWLDPADFDESKRRNSNTRHMRLRCGVWAWGDGDALDRDDIEAATKHDLRSMRWPEPGYGYCGGMDLGVRRDHSAIVILGMHAATQRIRLAYCHSWAPGPDGKVDLIDVRETAIGVARMFGCGYCCDMSQAELMAQDMALEGIVIQPVATMGKSADRMANVLIQTFRDRQIDLYPEPDLIRDLGRLTIVERNFGYSIKAPRDKRFGHADRAMALAIALPEATEFMSTKGPHAMSAGVEDYLRAQEERELQEQFELIRNGYSIF